VLAGVEDAGVAEDFQALPARVVHEEEGDAVVAVEIASAEELVVAFEIGEAELMGAEHFQEAGRAAAMLEAGPAVAVHGGSERRRRFRALRAAGCCLTGLLMGNTITIRLPEELGRWLEEEAKLTGLPKGQIVREQLELSRTRKARQPFLDLAGSIEGKPGLSRRRGFAP
jgi:hypothetical protein